MRQDNIYKNHYFAEEGKVIIQKENPIDEETDEYFIFTDEIWLGKFDSIENYIEIDIPEKGGEDVNDSDKQE